MSLNDPAAQLIAELVNAHVELIVVQVKAAAGRPKDRIAVPVLIAALEEQRRSKP